MSNRLSTARRVQILSCLVEGNSILSTCRMTGAAKNTVLKLLRDAGKVCAEYQSKTLVNLPCKLIQCDEIWAFVGAKQKNVKDNKSGWGDCWTWVSLCQETKLVPCWKVGNRLASTALPFMHDLASRLNGRIQLTTDAYRLYQTAIEDAFGSEIDYGQMAKIYGKGYQETQGVRYSQPFCKNVKRVRIMGKPKKEKMSTSHVERQNLTMRMQMRRFTRLTNAFSKKMENMEHAVALHFMNYNFCRIHQSIRVTPAMESGISDHVWGLEEIVALIDGAAPKPKLRKKCVKKKLTKKASAGF